MACWHNWRLERVMLKRKIIARGLVHSTPAARTVPEIDVVDRAHLEPSDRSCPWCGSAEVRFIQRGYAGLTDERDQYLTCAGCNKTTYEIVAKTAREMRLGRYKPGDVYQDRAQNMRYTISRVLRSGSNEFLVYLKPLTERAGTVA